MNFLFVCIFWVITCSALDIPKGLPGCEACPIGLPNCGNTCWMNAGLQCLFAMDDFNNEVFKNSYPENSVAEAYKKLYTAYKEKPSIQSDIQPFITTLNQNARFTGGEMQDAQEGITKIIESLASVEKVKAKIIIEEAKTKYKGTTQIDTVTTETQYMLPVPVNTKDDSFNISLENYFKPEKIPGYEFSDKTRGTLTRTTHIKKASEYLLVHLLSFEYTGAGAQKIMIQYDLPLTLNIKPYSMKSAQLDSLEYDLHAVVAHAGVTAHGGHYIALIKKGTQWYHCDDTDIKKIPAPQVLGFQPYVLFFKRHEQQSLENLTLLAESLEALHAHVSK